MRKLINKKECKKYASSSFPMKTNAGIIHCNKVKYIVRCKMKNINHSRTLILYIYVRENLQKNDFTPKYIVFQTKEDFTTLKNNNGKISWLKGKLENLDRIYNFTSKCAFFRSDDEKLIIDFCKNETDGGFNVLERFQNSIQYEKGIEAKHKRQRVTINRMANIQNLPRNFKHWIHKKAMNHYIFYDYLRNKKKLTGVCTACNHTVNVPDAKHNSTGICPYCKHKIKYKARSRSRYLVDRDTVQIIQRYAENEFIVRIFKYYNKYVNSEQFEFDLYETARLFITWNGSAVETEWYHKNYEHRDITPWKPGMLAEYIFYTYQFNGDYKGYLYTDNLDNVLLNSPWQYSQLKEYSIMKSEPFRVLSYFETYWDYPMLEYFLKLKLYRLAEYLVTEKSSDIDRLINRCGKNINDTLGIDKSYLRLLQEVNPSGPQLKMIREMIDNNIVPDTKLLTWCTVRNITDARHVLTPLKFMTVHKLIKYTEEQFFKFRRVSYLDTEHPYGSISNLLIDYNDYLIMSDALNHDMKNDFVLFPDNLPQEHDRVNELSEPEILEAYNTKISKDYMRLNSRYSYEKLGFMIIPPKSADEIVAEGHKLHHCVGNYVKSVVKNECVILFLRRAEKPDKPYCTIEIKKGEIAQARMNQNKQPPKKVDNFLRLWESNVLYQSNVKKAA